MSGKAIGPAVAGTWYPAGPDALRTQVDRLVAAAPREGAMPGVRALVAPHAGFVYSGAVAAYGFRLVSDADFSKVVILGPSHYVGFRGAALPDADRYLTPLGSIAIDTDSLATLAGKPGFHVDNRSFAPEHCLEAELPFLQRLLAPGWRLVPILVGGVSDGPDLERVAAALADLVDDRTLTVVSSDFTHFGPRFGYVPFDRDVPEKIRELDLGAIRAIESGDVREFESYVTETGATICGRHAIGVLMRLLPATARFELVSYDTSGRITGDWEHSVSYASLACRNP